MGDCGKLFLKVSALFWQVHGPARLSAGSTDLAEQYSRQVFATLKTCRNVGTASSE